MPMKGMNRKAEEARAKKAETKAIKEKKAAQAAEDAKWQITDKKELEAIHKRKEQQQKAEQERQRKADNKQAYEDEQSKLIASNKKQVQGNKKLSKAEVQARLLLANLNKQQPPSQAAPVEVPGATIIQEFDTTNFNKAQQEAQGAAERVGQDYVVAQDVDAALDIFEKEDLDRHPEKRRKGAFEQYLVDEMPRIREEKTGLRQNQYKNILFKEFQTSMSNPVYAAKIRSQRPA